jgi:hypothetical protein
MLHDPVPDTWLWVAYEMSLPTVSWSRTGDIPPAKELDISGEISKRITEDFGISIGDGWTQIRQPGSPTIAGFGNLETFPGFRFAQSGLRC